MLLLDDPHPQLVPQLEHRSCVLANPGTLGVCPGACSCCWSRAAAGYSDARARSAVRGLAGGLDDGQCHRGGAGGAAVRARRRPGGVRATGGLPARPGRDVVDEQANTLDVTATIVDLAVHGYLTIEEIRRRGGSASRTGRCIGPTRPTAICSRTQRHTPARSVQGRGAGPALSSLNGRSPSG